MAGIGVVKALILQTLEQLGLTSGGEAVASDLQAVTDEGATTTVAMTMSGANLFGAAGVLTDVLGALTVREAAVFDADVNVGDTGGGSTFTVEGVVDTTIKDGVLNTVQVRLTGEIHAAKILAKVGGTGNTLVIIDALNGGNVLLASGADLAWTNSATDAFGTQDTFIGRLSAGVAQVGATEGNPDGILQASGLQSPATAVVATSDGLTTGLIPSEKSVVTVTVATDADDIITLPVPIVGMKSRIYIGGTGCEIRTPSGSNDTINNLDSDGSTFELALVANASYVFECTSSTAWVVRGFDSVGADLAALVPHAV